MNTEKEKPLLGFATKGKEGRGKKSFYASFLPAIRAAK